MAIKDVEEKKPMGLNLGSMPSSNPSAQLSLAIGNNQSQLSMAPELKRGGELE